MSSVPEIFRARWLPWMRREAVDLRAALPRLLQAIAYAGAVESNWLARSVTEVLLGAQALLPEADFANELLEVAAVSGEHSTNTVS
jgi:hypothetical protein